METRNPESYRAGVCFRIYVPTGRFNCSFDFDTGLLDDVMEVDGIRGQSLRTAITGSPMGWLVDESRLLPKDSGLHSTTVEYGKIAYTLYVRMVKRMLQDAEASSFHARPSRLEMFDDSRLHGWGDRFDTFSLEPRRKFEVGCFPHNHKQAPITPCVLWPAYDRVVTPCGAGQRAEGFPRLQRRFPHNRLRRVQR